MNAYTCVCMYISIHKYTDMYLDVFCTYIDGYIHIYLLIYMHTYMDMYTCMYACVTEVNMNIAGMGTFLFCMEFLYFCEKIPSLLHF